jgi:Flp pilus assembly protein TadG
MPRRQSATTIVSFALIAPIFLFTIFAISEGARIFNAWVIITNETREAARYGAVRYDSTLPLAPQQTAILNYLYQRLDGSLSSDGLTPPPTVTISPTTGQIHVTVNYKVEIIIPMIAAFISNPFPLQSESIMFGEPGS